MRSGFSLTAWRAGASWLFYAGLAAAVMLFGPQSAQAQKIKNQIAVFAALDKVTARVSRLEVRIGETASFGALKVTPRVCYTREPTEPPLTSSFVEVDEVLLNNEQHRVFTGWMFAESPGISGLEHQVFDVWLTSCKTASGGTSGAIR